MSEKETRVHTNDSLTTKHVERSLTSAHIQEKLDQAAAQSQNSSTVPSGPAGGTPKDGK